MIRRLGMCSSSSSSTSVGWQAGGCSFSASRLLCCGLVLVRQLDWRQRCKKGGKGAMFSSQTPRERPCTCVCACTCVCLTLSLCIFPYKLPYSHLSVCRQSGWRKFMLPMPVLSVKLIRLRAPDNSIISDSFNNRSPPPHPSRRTHNCKTSSRAKLPDITVLLNSLRWQDWEESTGTVPRG